MFLFVSNLFPLPLLSLSVSIFTIVHLLFESIKFGEPFYVVLNYNNFGLEYLHGMSCLYISHPLFHIHTIFLLYLFPSLFSPCVFFFSFIPFSYTSNQFSCCVYYQSQFIFFNPLPLFLPLFYPLHDSPLPSPINKFITVHCVHCHRLTSPPSPFPSKDLFFPTMTTTFFFGLFASKPWLFTLFCHCRKEKKMNIRYTVLYTLSSVGQFIINSNSNIHNHLQQRQSKGGI